MKKIITLSFFAILAAAYSCTEGNNAGTKEVISFYDVPLVCGAAPEIGCGSRLKPIFIDTKKERAIKESWSNREGTVIAIVWNDKEDEKLIQDIFRHHDVNAKLITDDGKERELTGSMKDKGKWYKEMDVDKLSIEEAGIIAGNVTTMAKDAGLVNTEEAESIKIDFEAYYKKELLVTRSSTELNSEELQGKWRADGYALFVKYVGKERADKVAALYEKQFMDREEKASEKEGCNH